MQGNLYWNNKDGIKYNYPYITSDKKCNVLIVGGGITGAITAYYQAKMGYNVIIVEQNLIGFGGTSQGIGLLEGRIDYISTKTAKYLNSNDLEKCNKMYQEALCDIESIVDEIRNFNKDCNLGYKRQTVLNYTDRITGRFTVNREYDNLVAKERKLKIDYTEENEIINMSCGIKIENTEAVIDPYEFTQELFNMLKQKGKVEIYENTKIDSINSMEEKSEALTTNRFKIVADKIILTTGVNTIKYLKDIELDVYKTYTVVAGNITEELKNKANFIARDINMPERQLRFLNSEKIMLNGEDVRITDKEFNEDYLQKLADGRYKKLYYHLQRLVDIEELKIENCFSGTYVMTKDNLPIIDEVKDMPNIYCNLAVGKNGIIHSAIGAKILQNICKDYYTRNMYLFRAFR